MESPAPLLTNSRSATLDAGRSLMRRPAVVHVMQTVQRFTTRLGNQFAAAITYFLVLALIPTLMFAFAALGFVLDVLRPELVDDVVGLIEDAAPGQDQLVAMLENFLSNWQTVGIIGVLSALYTAQGFIGNLKDAVRAQLRSDMEDKPKENFIVRTVNNTVTLLGILVMTALTIGLTVVGTGLASNIVGWLDLPDWVTPILTITPIIITLAMSWLIFMFIFSLIPYDPIPRRTKMLGSVMGAIALTVLLNLATILIDAFSGSPTAALFGPVIAIMLSMNVFARIILVVAAWMGTADDRPIFATISPAPQRTPEAGRRADSAGETVMTFAVGAGIIALTILGFKKLEERADSGAR